MNESRTPECGEACTVQLFRDHELVATHPRQFRGSRSTIDEHLPPEAIAYKLRDPQWCLRQSEDIGAACHALIERLFAHRVLDNLRAAQSVIKLARRFGIGGEHRDSGMTMLGVVPGEEGSAEGNRGGDVCESSGEAVISTERTLAAHAIALEPEARADPVVAVYDLLDRECAPAAAARVKQLIEALGGGDQEPETRRRERDTGRRAPSPGSDIGEV